MEGRTKEAITFYKSQMKEVDIKGFFEMNFSFSGK